MAGEDSLERLIPEAAAAGESTGSDTLRIHVERYAFAARHARPGRLLDAACGVGYGTRLLADRAPQVVEAVGVDLSEDAIRHARERYAGPRVGFQVADATCLEDPSGFDTVVSIETLEHVPDPRGLAERLVGLLRPEAILVASVPVTPSVDANPHHLHDFTERTFRDLFGGHGLVEIGALVQRQPFSPFRVLARSETRMQEIRPNLPAYYLRHPGALARRLGSTVRHGFNNRYLTLAWRRG